MQETLHFKWEIQPINDRNQGIFQKFRALFPIFKKEQGRPLPLYLYSWITNFILDFSSYPGIMWLNYLGNVLSRQKIWSSRPEVLCKKAVAKHFIKTTGKNLCWRLKKQVTGLTTGPTLYTNYVWYLRAMPFVFWQFFTSQKLQICMLSRGSSSSNCPKYTKICPFHSCRTLPCLSITCPDFVL